MKVRVEEKMVEVTDGVIKATAEEIKHPDGRVDVVVHVPCLQIKAKKE